MNDLSLSGIFIYPVKSLGGISVQSADVLPKGLRHDRRWMLVDAKNKFMTQRDYPQLAKLKLEKKGEFFLFRHSDKFIDLHPESECENVPVPAIIWDDEVNCFEVSSAHSRWISEQAGVNCRLVYFPEQNRRPVDKAFSQKDDQVSLADGFPFLIIGEKSFSDLNSRLDVPLPMNRFRPNFVFRGGNAFDEDLWSEFSIGNNRFNAVKPCSRCAIITVDQDSGEKGKEPLLTLSKYRQKDGNVYFGQNLIAKDFGSVSVGDEVKVISKKII